MSVYSFDLLRCDRALIRDVDSRSRERARRFSTSAQNVNATRRSRRGFRSIRIFTHDRDGRHGAARRETRCRASEDTSSSDDGRNNTVEFGASARGVSGRAKYQYDDDDDDDDRGSNDFACSLHGDDRFPRRVTCRTLYIFTSRVGCVTPACVSRITLNPSEPRDARAKRRFANRIIRKNCVPTPRCARTGKFSALNTFRAKTIRGV